MPRRLYWCSDDVFRGCILREALKEAGFKVLIPSGMAESGFIRRRGSGFPLKETSKALERKGCSDLTFIDKRFNIRGQGDIDLLAVKNSVGFVAEVKTRLIISTLPNIGKLKQMLAYHLGPPDLALEAWNKLFQGGKRGEYDSPASISELAREAVAAYLRIPENELVIGGVSISYLPGNLTEYAYELVKSTEEYLARCGIPAIASALVLAFPTMFNEKIIPTRIYMKCIGDGCSVLGLKGEFSISYEKCSRDKVYGCNGEPLEGNDRIARCNHYRKCFAYRLLRTR